MKSKNILYSKSKFKNISCQRDGIWFDSRKEAAYYDELKLRLRVREILYFERQVEFDFVVNGKKICAHRVDFLVTMNDGRKRVEEVKSYGTMTDVWKIKHKLFEALYPEIEYKVVL